METQCAVCLECFNRERPPLTLVPCGHTVCAKCCSRAMDKCPHCRAGVRDTVRCVPLFQAMDIPLPGATTASVPSIPIVPDATGTSSSAQVIGGSFTSPTISIPNPPPVPETAGGWRCAYGNLGTGWFMCCGLGAMWHPNRAYRPFRCLCDTIPAICGPEEIDEWWKSHWCCLGCFSTGCCLGLVWCANREFFRPCFPNLSPDFFCCGMIPCGGYLTINEHDCCEWIPIGICARFANPQNDHVVVKRLLCFLLPWTTMFPRQRGSPTRDYCCGVFCCEGCW